MRALKSEDDLVISSAAQAVGKLGPDAVEAVPALPLSSRTETAMSVIQYALPWEVSRRNSACHATGLEGRCPLRHRMLSVHVFAWLNVQRMPYGSFEIPLNPALHGSAER
jgi:hypothetical protein